MWASQRRTVRSQLPLARVRPSGLKATLPTQFVWPFRVCWRAPVWASQRRTVRSAPALARVRPSGLKATLLTLPVPVFRV